jgi:hypothetical protein
VAGAQVQDVASLHVSPEPAALPSRLRVAAGAILIVGLASAGGIYLSVGPEAAPNYELEETKQYQRSLELYGGTANVLANDFREWFGSLWYGKQLAVTITVITLVTASSCWLLAHALEAGVFDDGRDDST